MYPWRFDLNVLDVCNLFHTIYIEIQLMYFSLRIYDIYDEFLSAIAVPSAWQMFLHKCIFY